MVKKFTGLDDEDIKKLKCLVCFMKRIKSLENYWDDIFNRHEELLGTVSDHPGFI
jgi:hypothetical protein